MSDGVQYEYLGDGVYVGFDGHDFALSVDDRRNPPLVYMGPDVIAALNRFVARVTDAPSSPENPDNSEATE